MKYVLISCCRVFRFLGQELLSFQVLVWLQQGGGLAQILSILELILRQQHLNDSLLQSAPPGKAVRLVLVQEKEGEESSLSVTLANVVNRVKLVNLDVLISSFAISLTCCEIFFTPFCDVKALMLSLCGTVF